MSGLFFRRYIRLFLFLGKLICFFSILPHPASTRFSSHNLSNKYQKPIIHTIHTQKFASYPKSYDLYEYYRSFLLSHTGLVPTSHSFASDISGNAPANYWLDEEEDDEEDYASWRPTTNYSLQRYSQFNSESIQSSGDFLKQIYYSKSRTISNNLKYSPTETKEIPKFNRRSTLSSSSVDVIPIMSSLSGHFSADYLPGHEESDLPRQRSLSLVQDDRPNNKSIDIIDSTKSTFGANIYIHHSVSFDPLSESMAQKMNDCIDQWSNLGDACSIFGHHAQDMERFELAKIWKLLSFILDNSYEKKQDMKHVDEAYPSSNRYVCSIVFQEM